MGDFRCIAAQGDLLLIRIPSPGELGTRISQTGDRIILAHSETGHHHSIPASDVAVYDDPADGLSSVMQVLAETQVTHERPFDTHDPLRVEPGWYRVRRQREYIPEGYRRVQD